MGITEEGGKVAVAAVEGLKSTPLSLALITMNLIFMIGGGYFMHDVARLSSESNIRRDLMMQEMFKSCGPLGAPAMKKGDREQ